MLRTPSIPHLQNLHQLSIPRQSLSARFLGSVVLILLSLTLTHCGTFDPNRLEEYREASQFILNERKPSTLRRWKSLRIHHETPIHYTSSRTSLLFAGNVKLDIQEVQNHPDKGIRSVKLVATGRKFGFGTATAISPHGYYLTAAHCVESRPVQLVILDANGFRQLRARVVWRGHTNRLDLPDIALLHVANHQSPSYFPLIAPYKLKTGTPILTAGFGGITYGNTGISHSAGQIRTINSKLKSSYRTRWIEFQHDAPLLQGDSGGPVIDAQGNLLGITSFIEFTLHQILYRPWLHSYTSTAICPDPAWMNELIQADQAKLQKQLEEAAAKSKQVNSDQAEHSPESQTQNNAESPEPASSHGTAL